MNILKKFTNKSLKLNKKRTIGTIIGIILSSALICAVATMVTSFRYTLLTEAIDSTGYYHIEIEDANNEYLEKVKLNKDIKDVYKIYNIGLAKLDRLEEENPYMHVFSASHDTLKNLKYHIISGRYPDNNKEVVINELTASKADLKVGDTISVMVGTRVSDDGYELSEHNPYEEGEILKDATLKTYKIVGIVENGSFWADYVITTKEESDKIDLYLALAKPRDYKASLLELTGANSYDDLRTGRADFMYGYEVNNELLRWEVFAFSNTMTSALYTIAGVVMLIIIITSIFCIRNSFAISTTEKMKMYGMLASVGATKKQIKKSVIYEGMILSLIGIPLGLLCGIIGDYLLFKVVNIFLKDFMGTFAGILFKVSIYPVILAIILGILTIYFSSISSAKKASRVSPIDNLRNAREVKISSKNLRTPKIISSVFKTGGTLAYKNLKRSKKKYRTTVISLTVSIFTFISVYAFINEGMVMTGDYYTDYDYNFVIYRSKYIPNDNDVKVIRSLNSVDEAYIVYNYNHLLYNYDLTHANYKDTTLPNTCDDDDEEGISNKENCRDYLDMNVVILDDITYKKYAQKAGLNYDEVKDKAILNDTTKTFSNGKTIEEKRYNYQKGDELVLYDYKNNEYKFIIGGITNKDVYGTEGVYYYGGYLVLNKNYYPNDIEFNGMYISANDPDTLEKDLEKYNDDITFSNYEDEVRAQKSMIIVVSIFLYGFIAVISLIGVTNIFNTITSNMELRAKEFAMLKSIGMTKKEFNRMVNLETLFYSSKALLYGTIFGLIGSYLIHLGFNKSVQRAFVIPYEAIIICIIFVFVIVYIIMRYSIKKINKQNIIDTIRNDNI